MKLSDAQEKYKTGGGDYFKLENDGDKAVVRFLYDLEAMPIDQVDTESLDCFVVHEIEIDGKRRTRQCTTTSDCTDCRSGNKAKLKIFIQMVDSRDGKVKVWERSAKYASTLLGLITRYGPLCNRPYEIERTGAKGDLKTTYAMYSLDKDDKKLADLPDRVDIIGGMVIPAGEEPTKQMTNEAKQQVSSNAGVGRRAAVTGKEYF